MGIKNAKNGLVVVLRRVYAHCCSAWRALWQVSGQRKPEAKQFSLPSSLVFPRRRKNCETTPFGLSRSKQTLRRLRKAMVCAEKISRAVRWPIGATRTSGHRKLWQRASNAWDMASAAKWWATLRLACVEWKITGSLPSKRSFAFPSSSFSPRRFRIQIWNMANVPPRHCPILIRQRNPGANAKS